MSSGPQTTPYNAVPLYEDGGSATPVNGSPPHTPLPTGRFLGQDPDSSITRNSVASSNLMIQGDNSSGQFLNPYHDNPREGTLGYSGGGGGGGERDYGSASKPRSRRRPLIIGLVVLALIIIVVAVAVPIAIKNSKKDDSSASSNSSAGDKEGGGKNGGSKDSDKPKVLAAVSGGDGSEITLESGKKIKYANSFGGTWYYDINDPFKSGAKVNSWTPALNETWKFGVDKIYGVNLGGWLVLEPFMQVTFSAPLICPAPFEKYPKAVDEYTLHQEMAADSANGGLEKIMEEHYKTFITEDDFAEIASAGLNWVRLPMPFWAVETHPSEPYLQKVAWKYVQKAIQWARKYGIRINLDLHTVPGCQNDWNHCGRRQAVNFLSGPMGIANAERALDVIRVIAEFISQPEYVDVVPLFGFINEPRAAVLGKDPIASFYVKAYETIRGVTGKGKGPWIAIHDAMLGKTDWTGFLKDADRVALDSHPYIAFSDSQDDSPWESKLGSPCGWGNEFNNAMNDFGFSSAGEWSNAINDCGLWLNGIPEGTRYDGTYNGGNMQSVGSCSKWTDWEKWDDGMKAGINKFTLASMDGLQNWFFWTWKIGASSKSGKVESPAWSYQLGFRNGWMPKDPRQSKGACNYEQHQGEITGLGSGNTDNEAKQYPWPPPQITNAPAAVGDLPRYTATGPIPTLAAATFAPSGMAPTGTPSMPGGWFNKEDKTGYATEIEGCKYPPSYAVPDGPDLQTPWCSNAKREAAPEPIPAPKV